MIVPLAKLLFHNRRKVPPTMKSSFLLLSFDTPDVQPRLWVALIEGCFPSSSKTTHRLSHIGCKWERQRLMLSAPLLSPQSAVFVATMSLPAVKHTEVRDTTENVRRGAPSSLPMMILLAFYGPLILRALGQILKEMLFTEYTRLLSLTIARSRCLYK